MNLSEMFARSQSNGSIWIAAFWLWALGYSASAIYWFKRDTNWAGGVALSALWPVFWPLWLITWPLRRVWRGWRGRRTHGNVASHKGYLFAMSEPMIDKHSVCVWRADFFTGFAEASGDARAGDVRVGSDPSEPPPVANSAAGRPYGSKPPVNHTVERVDDLERRVAGLEGVAQHDQRAYRDHGCGSSEIVRFFPSHKAFVVHPPEWAHSVYDESYCIKTGMYRMGDAEALKIWKQRPPETIRVCKAGAEPVLYDPRGNWWRKTATGWHEIARPSLQAITEAGGYELHGAERDAVIADWRSRDA